MAGRKRKSDSCDAQGSRVGDHHHTDFGNTRFCVGGVGNLAYHVVSQHQTPTAVWVVQNQAPFLTWMVVMDCQWSPLLALVVEAQDGYCLGLQAL